jgi:hypothetical protein
MIVEDLKSNQKSSLAERVKSYLKKNIKVQMIQQFKNFAEDLGQKKKRVGCAGNQKGSRRERRGEVTFVAVAERERTAYERVKCETAEQVNVVGLFISRATLREY